MHVPELGSVVAAGMPVVFFAGVRAPAKPYARKTGALAAWPSDKSMNTVNTMYLSLKAALQVWPARGRQLQSNSVTYRHLQTESV